MSCTCIRVARSIASPARRASRRPRLAATEQLRLQQHGRERRAQLVRQRGQELVLGAVRALGLGSRLLRRADVLLERVDVDERQDGAVDPVVDGRVGPDLHAVPVPVAILDLRLLHGRPSR